MSFSPATRPAFRAARGRRFLATFLSLLLTAALLPIVPAAAQGSSAPVVPSDYSATFKEGWASNASASSSNGAKEGWASDVFIIRRDESGATTCRVATPEEQRNVLNPEAGGLETVLIYPGAPTRSAIESGEVSTNALVTETGLMVQPSAGLRIVLHGTDQLNNNAQARDAFIAAANRWESIISTQMTVVIDVDYGPTFFNEPYGDDDILGQTSTSQFAVPLSTVREQLLSASPVAAESTLYNALPATNVPAEIPGGSGTYGKVALTKPQVRALGMIADITNPDSVPLKSGDAGIGFNSAHDFDFNPNDGIVAGTTDFDAVVVHEIGHALGFISDSGEEYSSPSLLDLFRLRPGAANAGNLGTVASAQRVMIAGGTQVFFSNRTSTFGGNELGLSTGGPEAKAGDLRQSSHWKANELAGGRYIGIMDPTISAGSRDIITDNDKLAFDTFGYRLDGVMVSPPAAPSVSSPSNDNFANAVTLTGGSGSVTGNNFYSTLQSGEPDQDGDAPTEKSSVWYRWTAPASGSVTFDTIGSDYDYDTTLGAYTGSNFNALQTIVQNDDIVNGENRASRITFTATAGTTYQIMVNGWDSSVGNFKLNWAGPSAVQSTFEFSQASYDFSENAGNATLTVKRSGDASLPQSVNYGTSNGTAIAGSDFTASVGTAAFAAGETTKNISVPIINDDVVEPNETFSITLSSPTGGATLGSPSTANVNIFNDDTAPLPAFQFASASATASENNGLVTLTLTRSNNIASSHTADLVAYDGTAFAGADYEMPGGSITFQPGETTKTFNVTLLNNTTPEPNKSFTVVLATRPSVYSIGTQGSVTVTVTDEDPVPVNSVQLSTTQINVVEGATTKVDVTVNRAGDTSQPAEVSYSTANGTATDLRDYLAAHGTLRFAAGETSKTFSVFLVDDAFGNGNTGGYGDSAVETFNIVLTNPVLANLGVNVLLEVRITNNETVDGPNPVKNETFNSQFFVRQQYVDFLNREPDAGGLAFWTNQITECEQRAEAERQGCREVRRINVSAAFFQSPEFQDTGFWVVRAQRVAFGRRSDNESSRMTLVQFTRDARQVGEGFIGGQAGSEQVLEQNRHAYAMQIVSSPEFNARFSTSLSPTEYVDALFASAGVTPTATERQLAIDTYNNTPASPLLRRAAAFRRVIDADSVRTAEFRTAFVLMQYFGYLRKDPDQGGFNFWLGKLNQFNGNFVNAEMVKAFILSGDYLNRFGQ